MANVERGEVEVQLGERKLVFRLGCNEMIGLQEALGCGEDFGKFLGILLDTPRHGFGVVRKTVHAMLLTGQPTTTEQEAGDIITEMGVARINGLIQETMRWTLPPKPEGKAEGPTETAPSAGPSAGASS